MQFTPAQIYHVYNQGNNQERTFHDREDYLLFLQLVRKQILPYCQILAWCLMPNHFHFLLVTSSISVQLKKVGGNELTVLNNGFRLLQVTYAQYFNRRYRRTGSLFRQKAKSKCLSDEAIDEGEMVSNDTFNGYPWACLHYIHQNPVKANLVVHPGDWEYSSFSDYAGIRSGSICQVETGKKLIGLTNSDFVAANMVELPDWRLKKLFV